MAKGQQQNKDKANKKPKKDGGSSKDSPSSFSDRPVAPVTTVMPKGKLKNKPG